MAMSSLMQVAWSPAWGEGPSRYAMVAVSTKAGRVWLWRYNLPSEYSAAADGNSLAQRFTLVRILFIDGSVMHLRAYYRDITSYQFT